MVPLGATTGIGMAVQMAMRDNWELVWASGWFNYALGAIIVGSLAVLLGQQAAAGFDLAMRPWLATARRGMPARRRHERRLVEGVALGHLLGGGAIGLWMWRAGALPHLIAWTDVASVLPGLGVVILGLEIGQRLGQHHRARWVGLPQQPAMPPP